MIAALFWTAVALVVYTYIVFPVVVFVRGATCRRSHASEAITPHVSMIIVAHNEADSIRDKLENILALDYPRELLEVLVASDGSTDGTNAIAGQYASHGVRLLAMPRRGKIPTLNAAVERASGDVLVFSDANSMFAADAVRALVRPFSDLEVGGVAGDQRYRQECGGTNAGERHYWDFDRLLKQMESAAGSATSATGAIYAIRRHLFSPVPQGVTDDFAVSTGVIRRGFRLVFAPDAAAYEPAASAGRMEFRRKVRIITRGLCGVLARRELLNPLRYGFYAVQLFSHKVLRRLVVLPLLLLLAISPLVWPLGIVYQAAVLAQVGLYGCGLLGWALERTRWGRAKPLALAYFFCMVNAASLCAVVNVLRGRRIDVWEPQRPVVASVPVLERTPQAPREEIRHAERDEYGTYCSPSPLTKEIP